MRNEERMLLFCSRVDMQDRKIKPIKEIAAGGLDWEYLTNLALYHRVFPLLYRNIHKNFPNILPDTSLQQLKNLCIRNGVKNLFLVDRLFSVLKLLEKNNILALPFKGPVLTENIYGDIGLRSFGDLDLLISRTDLEKAILVLLEQGFRLDINLDPEQYIKLVVQGHHAVLIKDGAVIELHWELTGRYFSRKVVIESLQSRVEDVTLCGENVKTLGSEDLLVYLCIHGCRHQWVQLDAVCCIAELVNKRPELDWGLVYRLAQNQGCIKMTFLGLLLANKLLGLAIPTGIERIVARYTKLDNIAELIVENIFRSQKLSQKQMGYREYVFFHYALMDRPLDWFYYCIKPLFNPTHSDWLWVRLPAPLSSLYFILRPLRLLKKYLLRIQVKN